MDEQYHFQTVVGVNPHVVGVNPYGLDTDLCARTLAENYTAYYNTRSFKDNTKTEIYKLKSEFSDRSHTATIEAFKEEVKIKFEKERDAFCLGVPLFLCWFPFYLTLSVRTRLLLPTMTDFRMVR